MGELILFFFVPILCTGVLVVLISYFSDRWWTPKYDPEAEFDEGYKRGFIQRIPLADHLDYEKGWVTGYLYSVGEHGSKIGFEGEELLGSFHDIIDNFGQIDGEQGLTKMRDFLADLDISYRAQKYYRKGYARGTQIRKIRLDASSNSSKEQKLRDLIAGAKGNTHERKKQRKSPNGRNSH